ncbi:hypothetical protein I553_8986 [Mycobacterium xenopi 4042]|uniref:Uncharacterized protein n=1 Tax=Mycobacterium xenopi 4042 TaxID=1299334 RepID=X8APD0_MYCXE|nr:hypothetical protein I553_8986 [Mycobacterium xenopi 4042]
MVGNQALAIPLTTSATPPTVHMAMRIFCRWALAQSCSRCTTA